ncbi:IS3 family transposase [Methylorubrum populi]|uniref:IS3 family transposase n=1 Tax=Methylorubrum populi TaxID=223967 RepID=UPI003D156C30
MPARTKTPDDSTRSDRALDVSERRACRALGQHRSTQRKVPRGREDAAALTADLVELARQYGRYGDRKIGALLKAAGWFVNDKRVERIWRREGLKVPSRQPKRDRIWDGDGSCLRLRAERRDHVWSYDFVEARTHEGRKFRMLNCDLAKSRVRYGYFRIYILLRREGWRVNHKRVHRLYRDEGLSLRLKRPRRHVSAAHRERQPAALRPNERWSMDFVSDALFDGRRLRALTVVDAFTREALAIEVDQGIKGEQVVAVVGRLALLRGAPCAIQVDNGPEFVSKALDRWAYENGVTLDFSRPGKPTDNALVESFNGRLRDECLNANWFLSLADARSKIKTWRRHYNESRPHTALGWRTPQEFALAAALQAAE